MTDRERALTLDFIRSNRLAAPGEYRYARGREKAVLYASAYAAMTEHLLGAEPDGSREEWLRYFQRHQDDDGLFRDPVIFGSGWYEGDPLWCGRPHLSCHVLPAMACLGGTAEKELSFTNRWKDPDRLVRWLDSLGWDDPTENGYSNEIMNVANLLQYARDFHHDEKAGRAVETLLDWLSENRVSPETGLWGGFDPEKLPQLSNAVQAAYHWWAVFFYDRRPIPYPEAAIRSILRLRNPLGGFGVGVHHPARPYESSACEDIDALDPLCRWYLAGYRAEGLEEAIRGGRDRVAQNRAADGGLVFFTGDAFEYGHPQLRGEASQGAMFPTWFRTLTLAVCDRALGKGEGLRFVRCPGYQFAPE